MYAIVLDGEVKSALAAVRSLGAHNVTVLCGSSRAGMALFSRHTKHSFRYRSPLRDPEGFLNDLMEAVARCPEKPVLFSFSDATTLTLSRNRSRWEASARMPLAGPDEVERAFDKNAALSLARSLSIPTPPEYADGDPFPVVVKPRRSASWSGGQGTTGSAVYVFSGKELRETVERLRAEFGEYPLVERYIPGEEFGFEALCVGGQVRAYTAHHRLRSLSPTGGAAVVKETIEADPEMRESAEKLLQALSWEGVAMVEFKRDQDGRYVFLEINGRFWGSLPLAIFAGADFPMWYFDLAHGKTDSLPSVSDAYERGVRSRHVLGDVRHLVRVLFANDPMRSIAYPTRRKALSDFFKSDSIMRYDVWDPRDPLPSVMEVLGRFSIV